LSYFFAFGGSRPQKYAPNKKPPNNSGGFINIYLIKNNLSTYERDSPLPAYQFTIICNPLALPYIDPGRLILPLKTAIPASPQLAAVINKPAGPVIYPEIF
jgi:hypothetical protein